jgi:hypothetical protein
MKPKPHFRVMAVGPDGLPILILKQFTRYGAESVLRLVRYASSFAELHIEDDLESAAGGNRDSAINGSSPVTAPAASRLAARLAPTGANASMVGC